MRIFIIFDVGTETIAAGATRGAVPRFGLRLGVALRGGALLDGVLLVLAFLGNRGRDELITF